MAFRCIRPAELEAHVTKQDAIAVGKSDRTGDENAVDYRPVAASEVGDMVGSALPAHAGVLA